MYMKCFNLKKKGLLLWLFLLPAISYAQIAITGAVTDVNGEPIIGANIVEAGTRNSAVTDVNGQFSLTVASNAVLQVSYLGYVAQEIAVGNRTQLQITLQEDLKMLGEVVVTALGIERNTRTLGYATQAIKGDDVNTVRDNSGNIVSSLAGKVAGAVVTTASTGPGSSSRVVLRGNKSFSGISHALFVVDGVPYSTGPAGVSTTYKAYSGSDGGTLINPDDIVSINVLKGPAAAALYGSSAANGAVMITTKQGREGRFSIDYNGGVSVEQPVLLMDLQNTYGRGSAGIYSQNIGKSWGAPATCYPDNVRNFFETAPSFNNSVSAYGGTRQIQGYASYANNTVNGVVPNNRMDKNTVNVRVNTNIIKGLTTDTKITYVNQTVKGRPPLGDAGVANSAYMIPRDMSDDELKQYEIIDPVTQQPVRQYWYSSAIYDNPYWIVNRNLLVQESSRTMVLGSAKYQFTDWLSIQGRINYDRSVGALEMKMYDGTKSSGGEVSTGGSYRVDSNDGATRQLDILLSGANKLGAGFEVTYHLGASGTKSVSRSISTNTPSLEIPNKFHINYASAKGSGASSSESRLNSVYGSLQVGFRNAVFLDVTGRNDWSSTLPAPYRYFYPSIGLSAVLSDLIAMPSWVNFGKIRGAYTQVGNGAAMYRTRQTNSFITGLGQGVMYASDVRLPDQLKPEQTGSWEVGLEARFLNHRVGFDFAWYHSNSYNFLMGAAVPVASGYTSQYINAGNIENRGVELQLNAWPVVTKDFEWATTLNFARNINKIIEITPYDTRLNIYNGQYGAITMREGESHGELFGYVWKKDEASGKYIVNANGLPVVEIDQKVGNYNPDCQIGWHNSFTWKGITLSVLLDARIGGEIISGTDSYLASFGTGEFTEKYRNGGWVLDAVYENGAPNTTAITAEQFWTTVSQSRNAWADFFTYDATNVRIRELSLSYNFRLKDNWFIKSAQVALTGRNLLLLYRGKSKLDIPGIGKRTIPVDPESAMSAGAFQGIEVGLLPMTRTFGLNVKLSF
jgi:TonB-linked SusC/RagA family outer membrane protein